MKIIQKEFSNYCNNFISFEGSNIESKLINNCYVVLSYGYYPIFVFKDGIWYKNNNGYSNTTKRQMLKCNISNFKLKSIKELKDLYK